MTVTCSNCQTENNKNSKYCSACGYVLPIVEKFNAEIEPSKKEVGTGKLKLYLKIFLGFAIGFAIMFFITQSLFKPSIDKQLADFANEYNKTCPVTIDEFTTLKNVVALPNKTVQYNYSLIGISKAEVKLDTVQKYLFPSVLQNVKTNPGMKLFRDNKVTLNYYYSDKNGEFVTEYVVTPKMYQ